MEKKTELGFVVKRPYEWAIQRKVCPSFIISRGIDDSSNLQINDSTNRFSLFEAQPGHAHSQSL